EIPSVSYQYVRGGVSLAYPITDRLAVRAGLAWRHLLGTGEFQSDEWFPRVTGAGVDSALGITYDLFSGLSAHLSADLRRYFFAMNPEVGDELIVGGAIDQYLSMSLGLGWRWPG